MKNIMILFLLVVWLLPAFAQKIREPEITDVKVWTVGDSVAIKFQVIVNKKMNGRNYKQVFTPVLYKDSISRTFPEISVKTRRTRILDTREEISYGRRQQAEELCYEAGRDTLIDYLGMALYQEWMDCSALRLDRRICGCCSDSLLSPIGLADHLLQADTVKKAIVTPEQLLAEQFPRMIEQDIAVNPLVEPVTRKWNFTHEDMIIDFRVSMTEIDFTLFENRRTLGEIVEAIRAIRSMPGTNLNKIEITGYASPEGPQAFNKKIAGERAGALKTYILQQIPVLKGRDFALNNGGENWTGLRKMVVASHMPYKNEVLYIIDHVPAEIDYVKNTSRKKQLMDLAGGVPYNYMSRAFFSKLRNACYISIYYNTVNDAVADVINSAILLLRDKKFDKALELLLPVQQDSRAWNSIGVCYLMTQRYGEAKTYLQKAADGGNVYAQRNLSLIP